MNKTIALFCLVLCGTLISAFKQFDLFEKSIPSYFPKPVYNFKKNPLTAAKIRLGRVLFYDPILSRDNTISCASCHSPYNSFAHSDHALSHGIDNQIGTRNAPALMNLAWQPSFLWDGAVNHLDVQSLFPITHPKEMDEKIENVVKKLNKSKAYRDLFYKAYQDSTATGEHLLKAISQFMLTLVSANAKYDSVQQHFTKFTAQEKNGYKLFKKNCNTCHTEPLFSNYTFANNGLAIDTFLKDYGRMTVTKNSRDSAFFKIPSLRNLSYTAPYMHDGRFKRLLAVLNHYTSLPPISKAISARVQPHVCLTSNEKVDLIAFLLTLNDKHFLTDTTKTYLRVR
jgi:cytochrome c peroxidase